MIKNNKNINKNINKNNFIKNFKINELEHQAIN